MVLFGVKFSKTKKIFYALQEIFGIGCSLSLRILGLLGLSLHSSVSLLDSRRLRFLNRYMYLNHGYGSDLRRSIRFCIKVKVTSRSYIGIRFGLKLPVRGQRTKTNSMTAKKLNRPIN